MLQIAVEEQVDAILLGGDLFHENKPSRKCMHKTMELLRHYCMGSRPCQLELLSDPSVNFPSKFGTVNYEDPNYNVSMPVFVIHGNHDDPSVDGNLSPIDILATAGLVNYFGKTMNVDDITIVPILLRKGRHRMALYGLGGVRDERLHRTFLQKRVKMLRPPEDQEWFNMMILHQNRVAHGATNHIPETFLDEFLDLVVWGHEHECQACEPTTCVQRGFVVCQPGSSVATSLCDGESKKKHVVILTVTGTEFGTEAIAMKTVRPFVIDEVSLRAVDPPLQPSDGKAINQFLEERIDAMIGRARQEWSQVNSGNFPLPLIRLKVDYSSVDERPFSVPNPHRFGQTFASRVANPLDLVHFVRRRTAASKPKLLPSDPIEVDTGTGAVRVEDMVRQFLDGQQLDLFPQNEFGDIVRVAVEKDDKDTITNFVKVAIDRVISRLSLTSSLSSESLRAEFERFRVLREQEWERLHLGIEELYRRPPRPDENLDTNHPVVATPTTRGRGRGRGRGASREPALSFDTPTKRPSTTEPKQAKLWPSRK